MTAVATSQEETPTDQIDREKRTVSYDMYDMTVRQLVDMVTGGEIDIAPEYQRHFVWDEPRESELIESIFLGIPVPSLYMAANKDGTREVVDGVQRLSTLVHFCCSSADTTKVGRDKPLKITELKKLNKLNELTFAQLPKPLQLSFQLRPIRVTTLNDKSNATVRYDLFERLNTGGVKLHAQEIRNCVFRGAFRDQLKELAADDNFLKVVRLEDNEQQSAGYEECVLRFFAFFDGYKAFDHSVVEFLNDYMIAHQNLPTDKGRVERFQLTMKWLAEELPDGIVRGRSITPINLFEAVAVGSALALHSKSNASRGKLVALMESSELKKLTTGGTNSRRMVAGRIEFVRDGLQQKS